MDEARRARIDEYAHAAKSALGPSPDMSVLQQYLFDTGANGIDAVIVTMQVTGATHHDAQLAYFNSPFRQADRDFHNSFIDALELFAETEKRQQNLCAEREMPRTPPL